MHINDQCAEFAPGPCLYDLDTGILDVAPGKDFRAQHIIGRYEEY